MLEGYGFRARHYSLELGRFLQRDPERHKANLNLYEYVDNNPMNTVDPDGKKPGKISGPGIGRKFRSLNELILHRMATDKRFALQVMRNRTWGLYMGTHGRPGQMDEPQDWILSEAREDKSAVWAHDLKFLLSNILPTSRMNKLIRASTMLNKQRIGTKLSVVIKTSSTPRPPVTRMTSSTGGTSLAPRMTSSTARSPAPSRPRVPTPRAGETDMSYGTRVHQYLPRIVQKYNPGVTGTYNVRIGLTGPDLENPVGLNAVFGEMKSLWGRQSEMLRQARRWGYDPQTGRYWLYDRNTGNVYEGIFQTEKFRSGRFRPRYRGGSGNWPHNPLQRSTSGTIELE